MNLSIKRFVRYAALGFGGVAVGLLSLRRLLRVSADRRAIAAGKAFDGTVPGQESMKLLAVQVFFRHGARTPLKHIPGLEEVVYDRKFLIASVPYTEVPVEVKHVDGGPRPSSVIQAHYAKVVFKGGVVAGMLTTVGKDQMYLLGKRLASRYGHFVGKQFCPETVYLRSTNIDRCIESLQCVVAGLFGHLSFKEPVLVQVEELKSEILIPVSYHCPSFRELAKKSQKLLQENQDYVCLVKAIQSHTGAEVDISDVDMMQVRDHIVARRAHGLHVPDFLEELSPQIERAAVKVLTRTVCGNVKENPTLGLSFAIGRLLNAIGNDLKMLAEHGNQNGVHKFSLFSCHDSSLTPLLLAMGCFDHQWPPYSADIAFELYEDRNSRPWVKVKYCGKEMTLRGCETSLITLDQFLSIIKPYVLTVTQYTDHCNDVSKAVSHIRTVAKDQTLTAEEYEGPPNI